MENDKCAVGKLFVNIDDMNRAQLKQLMINRNIDPNLANEISNDTIFEAKGNILEVSFPTHSQNIHNGIEREEAGIKLTRFMRQIGIFTHQKADEKFTFTVSPPREFDRAYLISQDLAGCHQMFEKGKSGQGTHLPAPEFDDRDKQIV